jgi:hypothetical protein
LSRESLMKRMLAIFAITVAALVPGLVVAQTFYAASGSNGVDGILYRVDPTNATASIVGPILLGGSPIGLTGLAQSPTTGLLYGITTNDGPNPEGALVLVDPTNASASLIGSLGASGGSDISFNAAGTLYVWLPNPKLLATVNLSTGAATPLGASGVTTKGGGGLAFSPSGTLYLSASGSSGTLDTLDPTTGVATTGPTLTGAPADGAMDALVFSPSGTLYAVNTDSSGSPTTNFLVTINTTTGAVTSVGALPGDMDALSTGPAVGAVPTLSQWAMIALAILLAVVGVLTIRNFRIGRAR